MNDINALKTIASLYEDATDKDSLLHLADLARLDPANDFEGADLRDLDAAGEDLRAFSFRGADLSGSKLCGAQMHRQALQGAKLDNADLSGVRWVSGPGRFLFDWSQDWVPLPLPEVQAFAERISPIDGKYRLQEKTSEGFKRKISFYEDVELIALFDKAWSNQRLVIYYLKHESELFRLNGTAPPIHEMNSKVPIKLNENNVLTYTRFFCFFIRGEEGPFYILEDAEDPVISATMDLTTQDVIAGSASPATLEGQNEQGFWLVDAVVFYSNALFKANYAVQSTGMVEMSDDELIATDLMVEADAPIA